MPGTPLALLLFVVLVAPGLCFLLRREHTRPTQEQSAFRDSLLVAGVSVVCNVVALIAFSVARALWPDLTPDVGALVRQPADYLVDHYLTVWWWLIGTMAFACVLGAALSDLRRPSSNWYGTQGYVLRSSWWRIFHENDALDKEDRAASPAYFVDCWMEDGSLFSGICSYYNPQLEETADRDVVLEPPIRYRPAGNDEQADLDGNGKVVISGRRVVAMRVTLVDIAEQPRSAPHPVVEQEGHAGEQAHAVPARSSALRVRRRQSSRSA